MSAEERREVEYAVHGGVSLKGHYYAPRGGGRVPVIVAVHGGGWRLPNLDNYAHLGPWLAGRGYAVLAVTHRLASRDAKAFPEAVHDVRAAVQYARGNADELGVDPERIALMGDSSGAHLAALVALAGDAPAFKEGTRGDRHGGVPTRVRAAIGVYGVYDLVAQWRHDQHARPRDPIVDRLLGVSLIDDRRPYFEASPLSWVSAKNNATAFLVAWGTDDDVVDPKQQSAVFMEALKQAGHYVRPVVLAGAPHYWIGDPLDDPGSQPGYLAPRLLRFLQAKL